MAGVLDNRGGDPGPELGSQVTPLFFPLVERVECGDDLEDWRGASGPVALRVESVSGDGGLGVLPSSELAARLDPGPAGIDAYLWIEDPGASDGPCNGGPAAGRYWPQYAVDLEQASHLVDHRSS
jgi:hypothetical protein